MTDNNNSRRQNAIINVITASGVYVLTMLLSLIVRGALARSLGQDYVGLNGVLTSVITSFAIADLGIDSVFIYLMYKPMADKDIDAVNSLMSLFRQVYVIIGSVFLLVGTIAIPFLPRLIGSSAMKLPHIYIIYGLFVLNTGISYFFSYYRAIINADQKVYIVARITLLVNLIGNTIQIVALFFVKSFLLYAILLVLMTITINVLIEYVARNRYSFLQFQRISISKYRKSYSEIFRTLVQNTVGGLSNKLGTVIVFSSDNIILANFASLRIVGMYSNYILISQGISAFLSKIIASLTASVGNLGVENDSDRTYAVFLRLSFAVNTLITVIVFPVIIIFSPFIKLWVGKGYVLPETALLIIVANLLLQIFRYPSLTFVDAFGLQWIQKWKSVIESIVNLLVSLILIIFFHDGLFGILIGTLSSNLLVVCWYEPYIVLRYVCEGKWRKYIKQVLLFLLLIGIQFAIAHIVNIYILSDVSIVSILLSLLIYVFLLLICYFSLSRNESADYFKTLIGGMLKRH